MLSKSLVLTVSQRGRCCSESSHCAAAAAAALERIWGGGGEEVSLASFPPAVSALRATVRRHPTQLQHKKKKKNPRF